MRAMQKLTALKIAKLNKVGRYGDGLGLWLQISRSGTKAWLFRFTKDGKAREMGLGAVHAVSLAEAREMARDARNLLAKGLDPIEARKALRAAARLESTKSVTFKFCAEAFIAMRKMGWKNSKHAEQWRSTLETYAYPILASLPVASVDLGLIQRVLEPIWNTKTETASRLRGRIESILGWATVKGYRTGDNPARWAGNLAVLLPKKSDVAPVRHHSAMRYSEIPELMARLRANGSVSARALEFTILTAARTGETIGARRNEIDFDSGIWTLPADRMKAGVEHRVPLCSRAIEILHSLPQASEYLFAGATPRKSLSSMAMLELLRGLQSNGVTVHGFRSSFMDWGHDIMGYPKELLDMALAHRVDDKTEAAYRRGDMFERRRRLMSAWQNFCDGKDLQTLASLRIAS